MAEAKNCTAHNCPRKPVWEGHLTAVHKPEPVRMDVRYCDQHKVMVESALPPGLSILLKRTPYDWDVDFGNLLRSDIASEVERVLTTTMAIAERLDLNRAQTCEAFRVAMEGLGSEWREVRGNPTVRDILYSSVGSFFQWRDFVSPSAYEVGIVPVRASERAAW